MKITFILRGWSTLPIAVFRIIYEYANKLAERGHVVSIIHPIDGENRHGGIWRIALRLKRSLGALIRGKWFPMHPDVRWLVTPTLEERFIPDGDAIVASDWPTANWVDKYPLSKGRKFYFIQGYEAWLEQKAHVDDTWRFSMRKIVISSWLKALAEEMGEKAVCVPNAIDADKYRILVPPEERDPCSIGMLYHPEEYKDFATGFAAVSRAQTRFPGISLKLFGVFPPPRNLPAWVRYARNPSGEELVSLYNSMSIFVHSSLIEGWGLPPAEAMACGCAVAATDSKGISEYADHDKEALISPVRSVEQLAENLMLLIRDREKRLAIARNGNARIRRFTWNRSADLFEQALRDTA